MSDTTIRPMTLADAAVVAALMPDLGYAAETHEMQRRFEALMQWPGEMPFVAERAGEVVGLCHAQGVRSLASDGYCEIVALVVKAAHHRSGVGRALVKVAVDWAFETGFNRVRLGSGVHREDAHRFYEAIGFTKSRPGYVFELRKAA